VNTQSNTAFKILQLLLRCGMVCQEELNVVLEMMPVIPPNQTEPMQKPIPLRRNQSEPQYRQKASVLELD
jgi:hypothetical protein